MFCPNERNVLIFKFVDTFQDILSQTTSSFDELVRPSYREASEHTAAAALTELRNNNHQLKSSSVHLTTTSSNAIVTSILSKNHIDHLKANSVSVIPIDASNVTNLSTAGTTILAHKTNNRISIKKGPNATTTINLKSESPSALEMQRLTQLQQHLETAAVLMDISKKAIISPPSSNPQSPSVSEQVQCINSSRMPLKRNADVGVEEEDLSTKRPRSTVHIKSEYSGGGGGRHTYQLDNFGPHHALKSVIIKNEPVFKEDIENDDMNGGTNQYDSDIDSNDSDPDRLQMDISSSQDIDDGNATRGTSSPMKIAHKHNRSQSNKQHQQQQSIIDSGRETPDSNKSDDHRTDPATTQLWQALARTTGTSTNISFIPIASRKTLD